MHFRIDCTLPSTHRPTCVDNLENFRSIYALLAANEETSTLLGRFRQWPLIFVPQDAKSGHFVYPKQVFWKDQMAQFYSQDTMTDSSCRIAIGNHYHGDPHLERLFLDIFQVEIEPGIDDYLPLLSKTDNMNKIWTLIGVISKLAKEQNLEEQVRGMLNRISTLLLIVLFDLEKCREIDFIPTLNDERPKVKYTDRPFYPHDSKIADLFADKLLIIRLPGKRRVVQLIFLHDDPLIFRWICSWES